jgi:hypothetical protein
MVLAQLQQTKFQGNYVLSKGTLLHARKIGTSYFEDRQMLGSWEEQDC